MSRPPETGPDPVGFGVLGCGFIGGTHARNLQSLDGVRLRAVCDSDPERSEALAYETGVPSFEHLEAMIREASLDALVIATPPSVREEVIEPALEAGLALYVEKPPALDTGRARRCLEQFRDAGTYHAVGMMFRLHPLLQRTVELIRDHRVTLVRTRLATDHYLTAGGAPLRYGYLQRASTGGVLVDQDLHMLDLTRVLTGEVERITARGERLCAGDDGPADVEDTVVLATEGASGVLGVHQFSAAHAEWHFDVELMGQQLCLHLDLANHRLEGTAGGEDVSETRGEVDPHREAMAAFVDGLTNPSRESRPLPDYAEAVRSLALAEAGERALTSGRWEEVPLPV